MAKDSVFQIDNLKFAYDKHIIFNNLNLSIKKGKITTIMGANGCGKSTLFNLITKNLISDYGVIHLNNVKLSSISLKEYAKQVAIVHQYNSMVDDIKVEELVEYGRLPYDKFMKSNKEKNIDDKKVERALKITGLYELRNEIVSSLSGGQKQRVWIAMAIAQDSEILFLDEPTTYLDVHYQLQILKLIKALNEVCNTTIVMVLHDINQALTYSDEIIALSPKGKVITQGKPEEVINSNILKQMYGVELRMMQVDNKPFAICV